MNHYTWIYVGGAGRNQRVGLYHSSKTGNLLIYIGRKIVAIDFLVFDSKKYSFFIEDELVAIRLERRDDEIFYHFEIDEKADTPLNRARHRLERKYTRQILAAFVVLVLVVGLFVVFVPKLADSAVRERRVTLLASNGLETTAWITMVFEQFDGVSATFEFLAGNAVVQGSVFSEEIARECVLPLEKGDEFLVTYLPDYPTTQDLHLERPSEKQMEIYKKRVSAQHRVMNPDEAPQIAECLTNVAWDLKGLEGLCLLYYQQLSPEENAKYNRGGYQRMVSDLTFQQQYDKACRNK